MDREDIAELFSAFGPVSIRRVFSGFGVYADDVCFSLFLRGELYLKADATTVPRFVAEGSSPFSYSQARSGKVIVVNSYWRLPDRLYDDPDDLAQWARVSLGVARATAGAKRSKKRTGKPTEKPANAVAKRRPSVARSGPKIRPSADASGKRGVGRSAQKNKKMASKKKSNKKKTRTKSRL